jgi:hypothetical protein
MATAALPSPRTEPGNDSPAGARVEYFTREEVQRAMIEAGEKAVTNARKGWLREQRAALEAQAEAHLAELGRALEAKAHEVEDVCVHRIKASRWAMLCIGSIGAAAVLIPLVFVVSLRMMSSGADVGIDAANRSQMLNAAMQRVDHPEDIGRRPVPQCPHGVDSQGNCAQGS